MGQGMTPCLRKEKGTFFLSLRVEALALFMMPDCGLMSSNLSGCISTYDVQAEIS